MANRNQSYDVVVIGAGAAGLACARRLLDQGKKVVILEARSRVGGRIQTLREPGLETPIELGAEFIHGEPPETLEQLESLGLAYYGVADTHFLRERGELKKVDHYGDRLSNVMEQMGRDSHPDRSFTDFIESAGAQANGETQALVRSYVEGFHGADPDLISEKALAIAENSEEDSGESFRPVQGYDRLVSGFLHGIAASQDLVHLNTVVKKIRWSSSGAEIFALSQTGADLAPFRASSVVVTVPIGVLKSAEEAGAHIQIEPYPPELVRSLSHLHVGHVSRIVFRFRDRFWEEKTKDSSIGFLHADPGHDFPTWWTSMPVRSPILTAWQGGLRSWQLSQLSEEERVQIALKTLSQILEMPVAEILPQLQSWHSHDWNQDPFALGAYSYIGVGGVEDVKRLGSAFGDTLFFAGEATESGPARGTVHGAIRSGYRAAQMILAKADRPREPAPEPQTGT